MKKIPVFLLLLFLSLKAQDTSFVYNPNIFKWKYLTTTDWYNVYYDSLRVKITDDVLECWMLYEPLPEQLNFLRMFRSSDNIEDEELATRYLKFAYSLHYHFWVCEKKLDYIMIFIDFDTDGEIIVFYNFEENGRWFDLSSDRYGENIIAAICDLYHKLKQTKTKN